MLRMSREDLAARMGLDAGMVADWEEGQAWPEVSQLSALASEMNISLDTLLREDAQVKQIAKIVITGGPCAGKTTAMSWIQNNFTGRGWTVFFIDETATQLMTGGALLTLAAHNREYQRALLSLQLEKERAFTALARDAMTDRVLIVCDRGALDNRAYMTEAEFQWVLGALGTDEVTLRDDYDAVFHLVTAAKGAERFYTTANNAARYETPEEAVRVDNRIIAAWTGHPHLRVIGNETAFDTKMVRLMTEISAFLGEPMPLEIERKFLIEMPDVRALEALPNCQRVEISQTYLHTDDGSEVRIRQRGDAGHFIYYRTTKRPVEGARRVEIEQRLTRDEYLSLLVQADPACRPVRKTRYYLTEIGVTYEIDIYPDHSDWAILEVELSDENQEIVIPEGLKVIREVTGEKEFSNRAMAMQ
ncbi:MAG: AAA family ATPase [Clostridia bacterium]|nr:AAA family ATPase [Clostridia bacterium]